MNPILFSLLYKVSKDTPLEIKKSTLPFANKGLFTTRKIKKGEFILYDETPSSINDGVFIYNEKQLDLNCIIKNYDSYQCKEYIIKNINCIFYFTNETCYIRALRDIDKNEELKRYYGINYWIVISMVNYYNIYLETNNDILFMENFPILLKYIQFGEQLHPKLCTIFERLHTYYINNNNNKINSFK